MTPPNKGEEDMRELALAKMARVLGAERAEALLASLLEKLTLELRTPDDLARFAAEMSSMPGFEGAVGAMLGVAAVMRGAQPVQGRQR